MDVAGSGGVVEGLAWQRPAVRLASIAAACLLVFLAFSTLGEIGLPDRHRGATTPAVTEGGQLTIGVQSNLEGLITRIDAAALQAELERERAAAAAARERAEARERRARAERARETRRAARPGGRRAGGGGGGGSTPDPVREVTQQVDAAIGRLGVSTTPVVDDARRTVGTTSVLIFP